MSGRGSRGAEASGAPPDGTGPGCLGVSASGPIAWTSAAIPEDADVASAGLSDALAAHRLLAIIRGRVREAALDSVETLINAGLRVVEVSLTGTDALWVLEHAVRCYGGEALIGAGSVRTIADLDAVLATGARFAVAPALSAAMAEAARRRIPALPGVLSPTDIEAASERGWRMLKLFPASLGGPAYLQALRNPYPELAWVPVGGVGLDVVADYLTAGAVAVGVGSPLLGDAPHGGDLKALRARAERLVEMVATLPR